MSQEVSTSKNRTLVYILSVACVLLTAKVVYDAMDKASFVEESEAKSIELQDAYEAIDSVRREIESENSDHTRARWASRHSTSCKRRARTRASRASRA